MKAGDVDLLIYGLQHYLPLPRSPVTGEQEESLEAEASLRVVAELAVWAHRYIEARAEAQQNRE